MAGASWHLGGLAPTLLPNSNWLGPVANSLETDKREVWLTIDDGPDPLDTPAMLDLLARHDARASFFGIGSRIEAYPDLSRSIVAAGHELQNHTMNHPSATYWTAGRRQTFDEIEAASRVIERVVGTRPTRFRAPVGMVNAWTHDACEANYLDVVGWTASARDGIGDLLPEISVARLLKGLKPGAILVLHEGSSGETPSTRTRTLALLLEMLREENYRCVLPPSPLRSRA